MNSTHRLSGHLTGWEKEGLANGYAMSKIGQSAERDIGELRYLSGFVANVGTQHCVGSTEEMAKMAKDGSPVAQDLHRPYVDDTILICPECNGDMKREPFVMDCWFDSGCASFAQWHHPFGEEGKFENNFPIDYICEGVDQTRGWFYTYLQ